MKAANTSAALAWLYGDHIMNIYASIIGIRRLTRNTDDAQPVDAVTLRAARMVISVILHFNLEPVPQDQNYFIFFQYAYAHIPHFNQE
jgi:hypothetical protein